MQDITDADYIHAKRISKVFETKTFGEYHNLYLRVIHYFWQMFSKTLKNDFKCLSFRSCKISFSSWISIASSFKKGRSKTGIIN